MKHEQFIELVDKLESMSNSSPKKYKWRVFGLTAAGYGYLLFILAIALFLIGLVVYLMVTEGRVSILKIIIALAPFIYILIRSMWVRFTIPKGRVITSEEAPELFIDIRELRNILKAPKIHTVLISDKYTATISQIPRLGVFGWMQNYLIIGMPLLMTLNREEMKAVIAHELGHLRRGDSKFSGWIYRTVASWTRLVEQLEKEEKISRFVFKKWLDWFLPYYSAYTFILRRSNEFSADRAAVLATNKDITSSMLLKLDIMGTYLSQSFWKNEYQAANLSPRVPTPFLRLEEVIKKGIPEEQFKKRLQWALSERGSINDTHPTLLQRLDAVGKQPTSFETYGDSSAEEYFGPNYSVMLKEIEGVWKETNKEIWRKRYDDMKFWRELHSQLKQDIRKGKQLSEDDELTYARSVAVLHGGETALTHFGKVRNQYPSFWMAFKDEGLIRLELFDDSGVELLEKAMNINPFLTIEICFCIYDYYERLGYLDKANSYLNRISEWEEESTPAIEERETIKWGGENEDTFIPNRSMTEKVREQLEKKLLEFPQIQKIYAAEKALHYYPDYHTVGVYAIQLETPEGETDEVEWELEWLEENKQELQDIFPTEYSYFITLHNHRMLFEKIRNISLHPVYNRDTIK